MIIVLIIKLLFGKITLKFCIYTFFVAIRVYWVVEKVLNYVTIFNLYLIIV